MRKAIINLLIAAALVVPAVNSACAQPPVPDPVQLQHITLELSTGGRAVVNVVLPQGVSGLDVTLTEYDANGIAVAAQGSPAEDIQVPSRIRVTGTVSIDSNLREGPSPDYEIVSWVKGGERVSIIDTSTDGSWYKLASGNWIASFLVSPHSAGNALANGGHDFQWGYYGLVIDHSPQLQQLGIMGEVVENVGCSQGVCGAFIMAEYQDDIVIVYYHSNAPLLFPGDRISTIGEFHGPHTYNVNQIGWRIVPTFFAEFD